MFLDNHRIKGYPKKNDFYISFRQSKTYLDGIVIVAENLVITTPTIFR